MKKVVQSEELTKSAKRVAQMKRIKSILQSCFKVHGGIELGGRTNGK